MAHTRPSMRPSPALTRQLLLTVVEQLKLPLMNIARAVELADMVADYSHLAEIQITADSTVRLLDNYLLAIQLTDDGVLLEQPEAVSVSSVLYDATAELEPLAKTYGVELDLQIDGKYGTVMANRRGLQAALVSLGYSLVEALPAQDTGKLRLELSAHRCRYGLVAGLYCEREQVATHTLRLGRQLYGRARQPLGSISHSSGAGVFVADAILHAMRAQLTTSRHHNMYGLGAVLPLNPQLQLV